MNSIQEEQYEYDKFIFGLSQKIQEIQQDFSKLSDENKCRVSNELGKFLRMGSLEAALQYFSRCR